MSVFTKAFFDLLRGDTTLCNMLAYYPPNTGSTKPAVFTVDPAPDDADLPYIVISGHIIDNAKDTKSSLGRDFIIDVRCYTKATGSSAKVEAMGERVKEFLHHSTITVEGYSQIGTLECNGPRQGPIETGDPAAYSQIVEVRYQGNKK